MTDHRYLASYTRVEPFTPARILALETSCDETSVAVLEQGRHIRCNQISSQIELHKKYGGVVPEIACRKHLEVVHPLLSEALSEAGVSLGEVDCLAVTHGPGLIGAVLVGVAVAKSLALSLNLPLVAVNHLEGHIYSPFLEHTELAPPLICLLVSGGHTMLVHLVESGRYRVLGQTRDDAAGEAFDKVAKLLGLGYPGGPLVDRLAREGDPAAIAFPRPMLDRGAEFSFSGLKTAVRNHLEAHPDTPTHDTCASFQEAVVDVLVTKMTRAAREAGVDRLAVVGGVACNSRLRERLLEVCRRKGLQAYFPSPVLCTDNAAMIARAGWELARLGVQASPYLDAFPNLPLMDRVAT